MNRFDRAARHYLHEMAVRSFFHIGPEAGHFGERSFVKDGRFTPAQERNFKRAVARALEMERRQLVSSDVIADGQTFPGELQALIDEQIEAGAEHAMLAAEPSRRSSTATPLPIYQPKARAEVKLPDVADEIGAAVREKHSKAS